jgi:hypothetical protein
MMLHTIMIALSLTWITVQATRPVGDPPDLVNFMYTILLVKYSHKHFKKEQFAPHKHRTHTSRPADIRSFGVIWALRPVTTIPAVTP